MENSDSASDKVSQIFRELVGERAEQLRGDRFPSDAHERIIKGILSEEDDPTKEDFLIARDISFNLVDWQSDAAFLVATVLFPERFTDKEIADGVRMFLIYAPDHIIEAARLGDYEVTGFEE